MAMVDERMGPRDHHVVHEDEGTAAHGFHEAKVALPARGVRGHDDLRRLQLVKVTLGNGASALVIHFAGDGLGHVAQTSVLFGPLLHNLARRV